MKEMVRQWLACLVVIGFSVWAKADVVRLYPYPFGHLGDPAEGAMQWYLTECDYGYALTHIGRCHWIDHPSTNESGEVSHRWTYGYETPTGHYTVPNTVSGYVGTNYYTLAVKGLGAGAAVFTNLDSVTISEGIEEICGAFYDVTNLTHVGCPTTLRRIRTGNYCSFGHCRSLQSITFPANLEVIGVSSFADSGLTSVELPESVTNVGDRAFVECGELLSVTLPNGAIHLGADAFKDCSRLRTVWYGGCVDLPDRCFSHCASLTSFRGSASIVSIGDSAFSGCSALPEFPYAEGLVEIGSYAFDGCSAFTAIDLPDGVKKIGSYAYIGCSNVGRIRLPSSLESVQSTAFYQLTPGELLTSLYTSLMTRSSVTNLTILPGMVSYAPSVTYRGGQYARVELPETVTSIGSLAFQNNANLKELITHGRIESIGGKAFAGCTSLTSLPAGCGNSVTNWGAEVFSGCTNVEKLVVPGSMKSIPADMFRNCIGLKNLVIEDGVETVSGTAFMGDVNLESIYVGSTVTNLKFSSYNGPDASKVVSATFCELHPPKYVAKAFLRNFTGVVYYPPTYADEWSTILDDAGIGSHKAWTSIAESDPGSVTVEGVGVEYSWLAKYGLLSDASPDAATKARTGKKDCGGTDMFVWQDFVAGTDPTKSEDTFKASITFDKDTGKPVISWTPELSEAEAAKREYKVFGKAKINDKDWTMVDGDAEDFNFFKVSVGMKP